MHLLELQDSTRRLPSNQVPIRSNSQPQVNFNSQAPSTWFDSERNQGREDTEIYITIDGAKTEKVYQVL